MSSASSARCPYCLADLHGPKEVVVSCLRCFTRIHHACFREHGRCTSLGCEGEEVTSDAQAVRAPGWELHPLLPVGGAVATRPASFLAASLNHSERVPRRLRLRLTLPHSGQCGRSLEGRVTVFAPEPVRGEGLRLVLEARIPDLSLPGEPACHDEAVLAGRARRGWLERIKLWRAREPLLLFQAGVSHVQIRFDPGRLNDSRPLPVDTRFGPWHALRIRAVLEAGSASRETPAQRVVVSHHHRRCGPWVKPAPFEP
jgi:hypothetical protein